jgi:hypothetical protein
LQSRLRVSTPTHALSRRAAPAALALLFWLAHADWPAACQSVDLEQSLRWAWSYLRANGLRAGSDWNAPLGPLGFALEGALDVERPWDLVWWRTLLLGGLAAIVAARAVLAAPGAWRWLFATAWIVLFQEPRARATGLLLCWTWSALQRGPGRPELALGASVLGALSLVHAGLTLQAALCLGAVCWAWPAREAGRLASFALGSCGLMALAVSHAPWNVGSWLVTAVELSGAWSEFGGTWNPERLTLHGMLAVLLVLALRGSFLHAASRAGRAWLVLAPVSAWISYRSDCHSFTGPGLFVPVAGWLAVSSFSDWKPSLAPRAHVTAVLALLLAWVALVRGTPAEGAFSADPRSILVRAGQNARRAAGPHEYLAEQIRGFELARVAHDLPLVRQMVGDDAIDVVTNQVAWLGFNDLHWSPRPVFLSHWAQTPRLQRRNRDHFESARAPTWVLFRGDAEWGFLPTAADAPLLRTLVRDYEVRLEERGLVLLEHRPPAQAESGGPAGHELRLELFAGLPVKLPEVDGAAWELELEPRPTPLGRLLRRVHTLAAPEFSFQVGPDSFPIHLASRSASSGVVISPFLNSGTAWARWWGSESPSPPATIEWRPQRGWPPVLRATLRHLPAWAPRVSRLPASVLRAVSDPVPERSEGLERARLRTLGPFQLLCFSPPASLTWKPEPGTTRMRGVFGLLPKRGEPTGSTPEPSVSAVTFRVLLFAPNGASSTLLERELDPAARPADGVRQDIDLTFEVPPGAELILGVWAQSSERSPVAYLTDLKLGR